MWSVVHLVFLLLVYRGICSQQETCTDLNFYPPTNDVLSVDENDFVNVTFWIKEMACSQTIFFHKVTVHTKTNTGIREYDGTVTYSNDKCSGRQSIQCISPTGPATLYKQVNRSHVLIEWELTSIPSGDFILIQKKLNVLCRPQFIDRYPTVVNSGTVNSGTVYRWMFNVKAYTTVVEKCLLTSSSAHNSSILVKCTLTGDLPYPLLIVVIFENVSMARTTWFLSLCVEGGLSETLNFTTPQSGMTDTAQADDARGSAKIMKRSTVSRERHPDGLIYGDLDFTSTRPCDDVIDTLPEMEYAAINQVITDERPIRSFKRNVLLGNR
ncbi:hypothetical protein C0Q70_12356 [Pomacea canaliculata]|uniref:Uncharacterized protein n=1 Tax=Pomacea canaliculata TaxID=400727 RepID=A0A2T7P1A7_POMCA|nr:hypothetical protein C0Q70_12356 [Pomacea canaliculata]